MNATYAVFRASDALRDNFAAELAHAAYAVALRHNKAGSWLDLELEIWKAMGETVGQYESRRAGAHAETSR